ncbi:SDR family oxidoreductase [Jeotgalibacillus sp. ET6]|uniref:elongation factor P 5-aminopentanone reductase n=1 Tax=Jeotgalibacillus sp. ET6 TaxID=3037260 RepID=UPI0024188CF4|nr:SDR family oxidoreductase [Jeotgalibacillus sp. ET6]MDG5470353.1 SDR family oxidoreductase [Jeotgalibacillus sp. ET6]
MSKKVLVLGASGGIGSAVAKRLVEEGWLVYAHYNKNKDAVLSLKKSMSSSSIIPVQADLCTTDSTNSLIDSIKTLDAIVHAGGGGYEGLLENTPDNVMDELWSSHVFQPARIIRSFLPSMRKGHSGSIVFISSIWGQTGASNEVIYSAVKGAQIAFVKALGKELALSQISVNAVAPGAVETSMTRHYDEFDRNAITDSIPAGRMAAPEEVAGAVSFLLGKDSSYITSQVLSVNGGWHA